MPRLTRVAAAAVVAAVLAGCSHASTPADPSGVPDAAVADGLAFRTADGLFRMPEAAAGTGGLAETAQYVDVLGPTGGGVLDWRRMARTAVPDADGDLVDVESYLRIARVAGIRPAASWAGDAARALVVPEAETDVGAEIGALWAYADTRSLLRGAGAAVPLPDGVRARLARIDPAGLVGSPYLLLRLRDTYRATGIPVPSAVSTALADAAAEPLPAPDSLQGLLDSQALLQLSPRPAYPGLAGSVGQLLADGRDLDDTSRGAALRLLQLSGSGDRAAQLAGGLRSRVSPATGLLLSADAGQGTVQATYLFSRLLDLRFGEVADDATRSALVAAAADGASPAVERLMAAAALRRAGDGRWKQFAGLAGQAAAAEPRVVAEADLGDYLATMEPAVELDPDVTRSRLGWLDAAATDDQTGIDATAAIVNSYLFANNDEVVRAFPAVQHHLTRWIDASATPFPQVVSAAAALPNARLADADSAYLDAVGQRVRAARGCAGAATLLPATGDHDGVCSLVLSVRARAIPGEP